MLSFYHYFKRLDFFLSFISTFYERAGTALQVRRGQIRATEEQRQHSSSGSGSGFGSRTTAAGRGSRLFRETREKNKEQLLHQPPPTSRTTYTAVVRMSIGMIPGYTMNTTMNTAVGEHNERHSSSISQQHHARVSQRSAVHLYRH